MLYATLAAGVRIFTNARQTRGVGAIAKEFAPVENPTTYHRGGNGRKSAFDLRQSHYKTTRCRTRYLRASHCHNRYDIIITIIITIVIIVLSAVRVRDSRIANSTTLP